MNQRTFLKLKQVEMNQMQKNAIRDKRSIRSSVFIGASISGVVIILAVCMGVIPYVVSPKQNGILLGIITPSLTPWESIGGCGAGGSGGGGGGAKWVGKGISGGLLDMQVMYGNSRGQNFFNNSISTRLSMKPAWNMGLGLSIPVVSKIGEVQPVSNQIPRYYVVGGLSDLALDYSYGFGAENEWSLGLGLGLPTAQYDIKRGQDGNQEFLPAGLQKGTGLYGASLTLSYTKDVARGMWLFDLGYSHPMNFKLFTGKNQFVDSYFPAYVDKKNNKRFYYHYKFYGENDLGDYTPPSINGSAYYGYKGVTGYMHSWGVTFGAPIGVAWVHHEAANGAYNPRPDGDNKPWNATFNYGLEVSRMAYPLFIGISLPFHAKSSITGQWTEPDMKDFLQQWSFFIGVKSTMF